MREIAERLIEQVTSEGAFTVSKTDVEALARWCLEAEKEREQLIDQITQGRAGERDLQAEVVRLREAKHVHSDGSTCHHSEQERKRRGCAVVAQHDA